jgi:protein SCO1/2
MGFTWRTKMRPTMWPRLAPLAAGFLSLAVVALYGSVHAAADNARWGANYFPNVPLTTQDGAVVHFYDDLLKGKIVAIDLIYTTCKYNCPLETARLAQVQQLLGDRVGRDVFFCSITIDPEHDTPAVLKAYAQKYHAGPGWLFLTGTAADIDLISRKLGLYSEPNPDDKDGHRPMLLVGNEATGQWMRNSALDNPRFLARTIGDWMNSWQNAKPGASYAGASRLAFETGQYVFSSRCAPCHTIGEGDRIGPDLAGVTRTRDRAWLIRYISRPGEMLEAGDPIAEALFAKYQQVRMPTLYLADADVAAVVDYLEKQHSPASVATVTGVDVKPIVDPYVRIQQALNADTLDGIHDAGRIIASEAAKLGSRGDSVRAAAAGLQTASDLQAARTAFGTVGDAILIAAKESGATLGDEVHVAFCPMARKYWLQRGAEIQNPFFGKAMSDCGRLTPNIPSLQK